MGTFARLGEELSLIDRALASGVCDRPRFVPTIRVANPALKARITFMPNTRCIAVVTSSRADYSHLYWPLRAIQAHPELELRLIVLGAHLSHEFGDTVDEIERDGFTVDERIECLLSSDSDVGMAKTIGVAVLGLADVLGRMRPDLMLLIADRYEMLAPASVALSLRIPIAHIEGGEVSEGAIDDAVRNALSKMSHIHFTPTELARRRVCAMGEQAWRVHRSGAPSLDFLRERVLLDRETLHQRLDGPLGQPLCVATFHPVTLKNDTNVELRAFLAALHEYDGHIVFCYPNADAGSRALVGEIEAFCAKHEHARLFVNLDTHTYFSLLGIADLFVGNSSSGIMETPSFRLPTVNIGIRQQGRERAANIIDVAAETDAIVDGMRQAMTPDFRAGLAHLRNPYGDGHASARIVEVLANVELGETLLIKQAVPLRDGS